jgi:hypothetical protein
MERCKNWIPYTKYLDCEKTIIGVCQLKRNGFHLSALAKRTRVCCGTIDSIIISKLKTSENNIWIALVNLNLHSVTTHQIFGYFPSWSQSEENL